MFKCSWLFSQEDLARDIDTPPPQPETPEESMEESHPETSDQDPVKEAEVDISDVETGTGTEDID